MNKCFKFVKTSNGADLPTVADYKSLSAVLEEVETGLLGDIKLDPDDFDERLYDDGEYILATADFDAIAEAIAKELETSIRGLSLYEQSMTVESAVRAFESLERTPDLFVLFTVS